MNHFHAITISIGTRPQRFQAALGFFCSDLIIPSVERHSPIRVPDLFSNNHQRNGTPFESSQGGAMFKGWLSQDTFRMGEGIGSQVETPNMLFEEAPDMNYRNDPDSRFDLKLDTVFLLAPYNVSYAHNFMSPLARLIENGSLDHNTFSLHLPTGPKDTTGWLTIGTAPPPDIERYKRSPSQISLPTTPTHIPCYPNPSIARSGNSKSTPLPLAVSTKPTPNPQ